MNFKSIMMFVVAIFTFATTTFAQVTTSSMSGQVTDDKGETLPGATVVAVHIPSGTQYAGITNETGRYFLQGMRPGGPYSVTIQFVGMQPAEYNDIVLPLGETYKLNANLSDNTTELEEIVVEAKNKFDASKTGASSRVRAEDIENMPSISHSIADAARLNPLIATSNSGSMSFSGVNNRYNSFQVDGAMNNDVFGLTSNGSNGGQAGTQPISLETLEQIQVSIAPFDVRQSGFTGGSINAITKSGTNQFHGSVYADGLNEKLIGSKYETIDGKDSEKYTDEQEYRIGATVGGPIIKNKLFFFINYEHSDKEYPNNYGLGSSASKIDATQAQELLDIMRSNGYEGYFANPDNYVKSDKAGVKLDYNINSKHKATISWRMVDAKQLNGTSTAGYLNASDYQYDFASNTNTFTAELQSRFSEKFSNELRLSYVRVRDSRDPHGIAPYVQINNVGNGSVAFGTERSSTANSLDQDIVTFTDNFTWYKGNHTLTFGTHNEFYKFSNVFIQDNYGSYYFSNVQNFKDFANGNAVDDAGKATLNQYRYGMANVAVTGDPRWAAKFNATQLGFYAQDKWAITSKLDVTYGIRFDIPISLKTPDENPLFNNFAQTYGYDIKTNQKLSYRPLWSPRLGIRYELDDRGDYVIRGGAGIFTGRIPFVWLSNNFSNTGIQLLTYNVYGSSGALNNASFILDPNGQAANYENLNASGSQTINVFAENFKFAQSLRLNLAVDFKLGTVDWTAEGVLTKTINDVVYRNLATRCSGESVASTYESLSFDNRPMLESITKDTQFSDLSNIYLLDNTNLGYSYSLTFSGTKKFKFGLNLAASYTYTRSESVNSGASSVAQSNYNYNYTYKNPNDPELGFSAYNIPNKVSASVTYTKSYPKNITKTVAKFSTNIDDDDVVTKTKCFWTSTVSLIYTGTSGIPYSIYYYGDLNGDGSNGNDLLFIPTDAQIDQMQFKSNATFNDDGTQKGGYTEEQQRANFKAWIASEDYLSENRGKYYERYADNEPWENHFDFHFAQRFNFPVGKQTHAIEFSFDIMNISNLFSPKWGHYYSTSGYYSPVTYSGKGEFQFLHPEDYNMRSYSDYYSRWRGQIGIKYIF